MLPLLFFAKEDPHHILGAVSLNHIIWGASMSARLGYSIDANHQEQGYGKEAVGAVVQHAFKAMHLHRLEAHIMQGNAPSIALATALGFSCEGVCSGYMYVNGRWEDHLRYALLGDDCRP
jgi:ribosomal-protein-alanine N-acetyltransferase